MCLFRNVAILQKKTVLTTCMLKYDTYVRIPFLNKIKHPPCWQNDPK